MPATAISTDAPAEVWWLNPFVAFGLPMAAASLVAYSTASSAYLDMWHTRKYFDGAAFLVVMFVVFLFSCGCALGNARRRYIPPEQMVNPGWTRAIRWDVVRLVFRISFALTLAGYVFWLISAFQHGIDIRAITAAFLSDSTTTDQFRSTYLTTIPGVTTATQFGIAVVVLGVPLGFATGWQSVKGPCLTILGLAAVRAFINSERLAVIELLVPALIAYTSLKLAHSRNLAKYAKTAPIVGTVVLYFYFAVAEYFRSWSSFYAGKGQNFWSFIAVRLVGYYATALNNGALMWRASGPLGLKWAPPTVDFLWRFPVLGTLLPSFFRIDRPTVAVSDAAYMALLGSNANPELNNPSGVFAPMLDYHLVGGFLYWLLSGILCGYLYSQFKERRAVGLFLYPVVYLGLIESSRVMYWASGRCLPSTVLLISTALFLFPRKAVG